MRCHTLKFGNYGFRLKFYPRSFTKPEWASLYLSVEGVSDEDDKFKSVDTPTYYAQHLAHSALAFAR